MESFELQEVFAASPEEIYTGWLDGEVHTEFAGGDEAQIDARVGGLYSAGAGYISGKTIELEDNYRIVQSWRTTEFPDGAPDSRLEIVLEDAGSGKTKMILKHSNIPDGQGDGYKQGWSDYYFKPMTDFFRRRG